MSSMQSNREFPTWMCDVKYQEGDIVIKDGILCSYWKYPKNGKMVWLPLDNPEQYDMLLEQDSLIQERNMKMKAFCLKVIHDFIESGAVKITYKGNTPLFDFDLFKTKHVKYWREGVRLYIGDGITLYHTVPDVVGFNKDGNILTFNVKEIIKDYKEI